MKQRYLLKEHVFGFLLGGTGSCISFPYLCNKLSPNLVASQAYQVSASRFPTRLQSRYSCGLIPRHNLGGSASQLTHSWYIHRVDYWTAGLSSSLAVGWRPPSVICQLDLSTGQLTASWFPWEQAKWESKRESRQERSQSFWNLTSALKSHYLSNAVC